MLHKALVLLLVASMAGCQPSAPTAPEKPQPSSTASVLEPERLRTIFPKLTAPFSVTEFRAKPGIVTLQVKREGTLAATLMVIDLVADSSGRKEFDGATTKIHGYPAVSTSMGGGVAVLVENRFRVEVVSLGPEVPDGLRSEWLERFDWKTLKGWAQ